MNKGIVNILSFTFKCAHISLIPGSRLPSSIRHQEWAGNSELPETNFLCQNIVMKVSSVLILSLDVGVRLLQKLIYPHKQVMTWEEWMHVYDAIGFFCFFILRVILSRKV